METYEKKYKDLVEAVKQLQKANPSDEGIQNWVNDNVPELRKSEDEKIRKELIRAFQSLNTIEVWNGIKRADIIAWLEKQGQKPTTIDIDKMVSDYANNKERGNEEFGKPVLCMIRAYRQGLTDALSILNIEKQCGQKPYGQREECLDCQFNYAGKCKGSCAMKRDEQKSVWNEEDEIILTNIIIMLEIGVNNYFIKYNISKVIIWLKSIKQRIGG